MKIDKIIKKLKEKYEKCEDFYRNGYCTLDGEECVPGESSCLECKTKIEYIIEDLRRFGEESLYKNIEL